MRYRHHIALLAALSAPAVVHAAQRHTEPATTRWVLSEIEGRPVGKGPDDAARFIFGPDHQIGGSAGCSSFAGDRIRWSIDPAGMRGTLTFDPNRAMYWTTIQCGDSPAQRDGMLFWEKMRRARSWAASPTRLTITFADGSIARLTPEPRR